MASGTAFVVFVFPVVFTVVFGAVVLIGALDELDREINMWPSKSSGAPLTGITAAALQPDDHVAPGTMDLRGHGEHTPRGLDVLVVRGASGNGAAGSYAPCQSADPPELQPGWSCIKNDASLAVSSLREQMPTHWV